LRDVVIAGAYMTRFAKHEDRDLKSLVNEAVDGVLKDSGCPPDEVELAYFGNVLGGRMQGQESCRGQIWASDSALSGVAMVNVENACASGSTALHQAWQSVGGGFADVAVALGAEKMYDAGTRRALQAMYGVVDQDRLGEIKAELGVNGAKGSLFMNVYARLAERYSQDSGATQQDFARVTVKNHRNGAHNPKAQYGCDLGVEEVISARKIAGPLTLPMCAPISDGAAAVILTTRERAAAWEAEPVRVLSVAVGSGRRGSYGLLPRAAERAFQIAGVEPFDVDVAECHDAAAPAEMIVMEELGLCELGKAPELVRAGETGLEGSIPINPSGGLECKGHPLGATGPGQIVELCDQLRDRAGERQVDDPRVALAENAGGYLGPDVATAVVTLLARA
jgi:acetyl-CoA acetyltransferase